MSFECLAKAACIQCLTETCCRILDNLPVAIPQIRDDSGSDVKRYERGFPVGRVEVGNCFLWLRCSGCSTPVASLFIDLHAG